MMTNMFTAAAALTDHALIARVQLLAKHGRAITAELVAHLAELETRKLLTAEAHSLFSFCRHVLHLSEHAAYNRIEAARLSRTFPVILDRLADGSLNLSTVRLLAPHLTPANHEAVLAEAAGKSKREVEVLVARLAPRPDVISAVRKLPSPPSPEPPEARVEPNSPRGELRGPVAVTPDVTVAPVASTIPARRAVVEALAPARYALHVTLGQEAHDDLRRLQDLLCLEVPNGDPAEIVQRALALLRRDVEKRKCAATDRPRASRGTAPHSRTVEAAVERAVRARDGNRCAFVGKSGRRCESTRFLELHHIDPYSLGGGKTMDELSLRCRRHNNYESELYFGPSRGRGAATVSPPPSPSP